MGRGGKKLEAAFTIFRFQPKEKFAWISEHPREALPTACFSAGPNEFTLLTSGAVNSTGDCATIRAWSCGKVSMHDI